MQQSTEAVHLGSIWNFLFGKLNYEETLITLGGLCLDFGFNFERMLQSGFWVKTQHLL
jgi:hypothetical protein